MNFQHDGSTFRLKGDGWLDIGDGAKAVFLPDKKNPTLVVMGPEFPVPVPYERHGQTWRNGFSGKRVGDERAALLSKSLELAQEAGV